MQASLIDDLAGRTLLTVTTASSEFRSEDDGDKKAQAGRLGALMAEKAKEKGIERVVFDRGGHPYHGRVRVFAEKAREGGLEF
jgi:large subunit ribosomal protein L18